MPEPTAGIRQIFLYYGRIAVGIGLFLLVIMAALIAIGWLVGPADPADWMTLAAGLIIVLITLGPYVATVGRLAKVRKLPASTIVRRDSQPNPRRQRFVLIGLGIFALVVLVALVLVRSLVIWLTIGVGSVLMGLMLLYIAWRIGSFEKAANIIIQATDYNWLFDANSFIGVANK